MESVKAQEGDVVNAPFVKVEVIDNQPARGTSMGMSSEQLASILSQMAEEDETLDIEEVRRLIQVKRHSQFNPLRQLRKELDFTQEKTADLCGVSKLTVSNYESGKCSPQLDRLIKYASALLKADEIYSAIDLGRRDPQWNVEDAVVSLVSDYCRWLMNAEVA